MASSCLQYKQKKRWKRRTYPEGDARLLFRLRILRVGIIGVRLDLREDLELAHDLLLGVRSKDGEFSVSSPCVCSRRVDNKLTTSYTRFRNFTHQIDANATAVAAV